jgi:hypothetical protein
MSKIKLEMDQLDAVEERAEEYDESLFEFDFD